jgi:DsbC/DsbD-like thiol-disulfide interchange protein
MEVPATSVAGTFFMPARPFLLRFAVLALLAALTAATSAQSPASPAAGPQAPGGARTETRHLTLTTWFTPPLTTKSAGALLGVDVVLKPKMHVYAPDQPKDQDYIPIELTVAPGSGYRLQKPSFPPSEKLFFAPLKETQHVYSKPFRITQPIVLTRAIGAESLTITGTVRYQACDDAICYVPQTVAVKWIVAGSRDSRSHERASQEIKR